MQKDVILYKRNKEFLRFLGLILAGITIITTCLYIADSIYSKKL